MSNSRKRNQQLKKQVELQTKRIKKAEQERPSLLAETTYLGTLGLLFVIPVVGGAYLGRWLDTRATDHSVIWTASFLIFGVIIGSLNVYFLIRGKF